MNMQCFESLRTGDRVQSLVDRSKRGTVQDKIPHGAVDVVWDDGHRSRLPIPFIELIPNRIRR